MMFFFYVSSLQCFPKTYIYIVCYFEQPRNILLVTFLKFSNCLIFYGKLTSQTQNLFPFLSQQQTRQKYLFDKTKVPCFPNSSLHHLKKNTVHGNELQEISKFKPIQARHIIFLYVYMSINIYTHTLSLHIYYTYRVYIYIYSTHQREMHQMFLVVSAPFFLRLKADDIVDHIRTPLLGPHSHGSNLDADARFFHQEDQQFHHMTCIITIRI